MHYLDRPRTQPNRTGVDCLLKRLFVYNGTLMLTASVNHHTSECAPDDVNDFLCCGFLYGNIAQNDTGIPLLAIGDISERAVGNTLMARIMGSISSAFRSHSTTHPHTHTCLAGVKFAPGFPVPGVGVLSETWQDSKTYSHPGNRQRDDLGLLWHYVRRCIKLSGLFSWLVLRIWILGWFKTSLSLHTVPGQILSAFLKFELISMKTETAQAFQSLYGNQHVKMETILLIDKSVFFFMCPWGVELRWYY